jgi:hypothetical protein
MADYSCCRGRVLAGVLIAAAGLLAGGCAGSGGGQAAAPAGEHQAVRATATPAPSATTASPSPATASPGPARPSASPTVIPVPPPPGNLPQTQAFPSAHTPVFDAEMTDLWTAVVAGQPRLALQAFFPLAAYTKLKAIYDAAGDWRGRLYADFGLDIDAAHRFLGGGARLVQVIVPAGDAAWVSPGVCSNSLGYWHVGGARLVYRQAGQLRSIGIASLISWRGRWYVVHFGAVLRDAAAGIVDDPASGTGIPGPAGGC